MLVTNVSNEYEVSDTLPASGRVDTGILAGLFTDRATSYKYFFFLALLERTKLGTAYESTITPLMLIGGRQGFAQGWEWT